MVNYMITKWIDKILNKFGYYKFEMPKGSTLEEGDILELMGGLGESDVFPRLLRDMCAQDIRLYFSATSDRDRHVVRGAHDRCLYFLSLIHKANGKRKQK